MSSKLALTFIPVDIRINNGDDCTMTSNDMNESHQGSTAAIETLVPSRSHKYYTAASSQYECG